MEFFGNATPDTTAAQLAERLRIDALPTFCSSIDRVLASQGDRGEIYCLWGQFRVHREAIRDGVRFSLPGCPNALAWTITAGDPPAGGIIVHCTINRQRHDADFIESIELFVSDWVEGLNSRLAPVATPSGFRDTRPESTAGDQH